MPFTVAAIGAGVSAAAGIAGGIMQSNAIKSGQSAANAAAQQGLETATTNLAPWQTAGANALAPISSGLTGPTPWNVGGATDVAGQLSGVYGPDQATAAMGNFQTSPGYDFAFQQGLRGVDAGAAAKGMLRSGATIKGEEAFGQGLADQQYQTYLTNANTAFGNYYNRLQALSGQGLTAAGGIAGAATGTAKDIASTDTGAATAQSNVIGNTANSISGSANTLLNNQAFSNYVNGPSANTGFAPVLQSGQQYTGGFVAR